MSQDSSSLSKPGKASPTKVDPEVKAKPERRKFSAEYKRRILEEADACMEPGQIGALLRREGLYSSNLIHWRQQRDEGSLKALSPKKRGPKPDPLANENAALRRRIERLEAEIKRAETIIEVQKKLSDLLGLPDPNGQKSEKPQ
jgi:transposase-like protein